MYDDNDEHVCLGEDAVVPDEADDEPCREVSERMGRVPGEDARRVHQPHSFQVAGEECGALRGEGTWELVGDANIAYEAITMIRTMLMSRARQTYSAMTSKLRMPRI